MKTKVIIFMLFGIAGLILTGCNNKKQYRPDANIVSAMNAKYPKATKIEWEKKHNYEVAEYYENGVSSKAWFDKNGKWVMTDSDLKYSGLPGASRNTFEKSMYGNWKKGDVDKIERYGMQPVYVIEVEKEGQDVDLYYTANGMLVKTVKDGDRGHDSDFMPLEPAVRDNIMRKYPDASVIEMTDKRGKRYVDILDNGRVKEVVFDNDNWVSTSWNVDKADVPSAVMTALRGSEYKNYTIDDITFYESADHSYYQIKMNEGSKEKKINVDASGKIVS